MLSAGWLLAFELLVAGAAIDRLIRHTPRVDGLLVLVVSGIAALAMVAGAVVLRSDDEGDGDAGESDLSLAAVLLDTVADATTAAGVATAGGISWRQSAGIGSTPQWHSSSRSSSPTTHSR